MTENKIDIKPINDLLGYSFFIPSYQRGYRWTKQQVTDLLEDINEFSPKEITDSNEKTWYCLQPIVVKQLDEKWEVIDGQQRLTTIFLILHYLNQRYTEDGRSKLFGLEYETRKGSAQYLKNELGKIEEDSKNIDYFHISVAYQTIKNWFKEKKVEKSFELKFNESTKIIWYETADTDSIDIFTRINMGKIPLTNAELIKALFLNSSNFNNSKDSDKTRLKQLEIATEWDRMEYALQDDAFWYFLNENENKLATRIEFIFDLMVNEKEDEYSTFRFFNKKFQDKSESKINENWQEIKKYFQTLEEWFNDRELYHKIGFLVTTGTNITSIIKGKKDKTKTEFRCYINGAISKIARKKDIDELEYGSDNQQLIKILLLHNIITTLDSEDESLRFPFDKYKNKKNGGWSLEHIHAQNSESITEIDDFEAWLKDIDKNIFTDEIKTKINDFEKEKTKEKIPLILSCISDFFGEIDLHSIENIALLAKNDNSKLNNGLFPVKRKRIIELEKNGAFVPIATKKVFQKYYDGCTTQLSKWEESDKSAYLKNIEETLQIYLSTQPLNNDEQ